MELTTDRDVLSCVIMKFGEQFVMIPGIMKMLLLFVSNWGMEELVSKSWYGKDRHTRETHD